MNKYNKQKFKELKGIEIEEKIWALYMDSISTKDKIMLMVHVFFKTRRGCLFLSCLAKGMSMYSAQIYAFKKNINDVSNMLDDHGWDIAFGKIQ